MCCSVKPSQAALIRAAFDGFDSRRNSILNNNSTPMGCCYYLEQGTGIEPAFTAWEAVVLPIYEPCMLGYYTKPFCKNQPFFVAPGKRTCRWKTAAWRFIYPKLPDSIYKPERRRMRCQTGQPQPAGQLHPAPAAALPSAQWHRPCFGDR